MEYLKNLKDVDCKNIDEIVRTYSNVFTHYVPSEADDSLVENFEYYMTVLKKAYSRDECDDRTRVLLCNAARAYVIAIAKLSIIMQEIDMINVGYLSNLHKFIEGIDESMSSKVMSGSSTKKTKKKTTKTKKPVKKTKTKATKTKKPVKKTKTKATKTKKPVKKTKTKKPVKKTKTKKPVKKTKRISIHV